jgi:GT2 family glycosyltransferase
VSVAPPAVSVVVPALDEGANLIDTVTLAVAHAGRQDVECLVVADGWKPRAEDFGGDARVRVLTTPRVGVGRARNAGAREARGELLVFLDGHCWVPQGWLDELVAPFADERVGLVGPAFGSLRHGGDTHGYGVTWRDASLEIHWLPPRGPKPHRVPFVIGACQAMRRRDLERLGGYDNGMTEWGSEDLEMCLRVWALGLDVIVQPRAAVYHLFRDRHPYPVVAADVLHNRLRMALLHLRPDRVTRVLDHHRDFPGFAAGVVRLLDSDVMDKRRELAERRCRDDDWLSHTFDWRV